MALRTERLREAAKRAKEENTEVKANKSFAVDKVEEEKALRLDEYFRGESKPFICLFCCFVSWYVNKYCLDSKL